MEGTTHGEHCRTLRAVSAQTAAPFGSTNGSAVSEGEMFKRKTQPKTIKDEVADVVHAVSDVVRQGSANAIDAAAPRLRDASVKLQDAASQVRPRVDRLNDQLRPRLEELGKQGRSQFDHLSAEGQARFDDARHRFTDEIAPQATERAGAVAASAAGLLATAQTPKFVDDLAVRVTGDKKAVKKARKALARASKDITKSTQAKKSGGFGSALVWILAIGGLAGIAYDPAAGQPSGRRPPRGLGPGLAAVRRHPDGDRGPRPGRQGRGEHRRHRRPGFRGRGHGRLGHGFRRPETLRPRPGAGLSGV